MDHLIILSVSNVGHIIARGIWRLLKLGAEYWDKRYSNGGTSGRGSVGLYRNWKWNKIRESVGLKFNSVIDVGCGDLSFWNHRYGKQVLRRPRFKYLGIDISEEIIKRNREMYEESFKRIYLDMDFVCSPAHIKIEGLRSHVVFCLDLLFHIMKEREFELILKNLCRYANQFLVIYTWSKNPFQNKNTNGKYQYYRPLRDYAPIFLREDLEPITDYPVPYDEFGKLYVFKRVLY